MGEGERKEEGQRKEQRANYNNFLIKNLNKVPIYLFIYYCFGFIIVILG